MNYLDIVNSVLRRIREEPVSSLYENQQSSVVSVLINDAKNHVENAHDWTALRQDIRITTQAGVAVYPLPNTKNRATIKDVRNVTSSYMVRQVPAKYVREQQLVSNSPAESQPRYWASEGVDASGDTTVRLWPVPDGIYNIDVFCVVRTSDLEEEGDTVVVPHQPIVLLSTALSAQERGGVDSTETSFYFQQAQKSLGEFIMFDAGLNPDEMVWYPK